MTKLSYIRRTRKVNGVNQREKIGLMIADDSDGTLKFGFSLLNPKDVEEVKQYNERTKKQIAQIKAMERRGKEKLEGLPELKPVFDKEEGGQSSSSQFFC